MFTCMYVFFLVASFDGLRSLLVASLPLFCSLANKLRSFVRSFVVESDAFVNE